MLDKWLAGQRITAGRLNAAPTGVRLRRVSSTQSISATTHTKLVFDEQEHAANGVNVTTFSDVSIVQGGLYSVSAGCRRNTSSGYFHIVRGTDPPNTDWRNVINSDSNGNALNVSCADTLPLDAGEIITAWLWMGAGGFVSTAEFLAYLSVWKVD